MAFCRRDHVLGAIVDDLHRAAGLDREQERMTDLVSLLFATPGPSFAMAKIAITDDPWQLPEKDGATIARRFRGALGL